MVVNQACQWRVRKSLCLTTPNSKLNDDLGQSRQTRDKRDVARIQE